MKLALLRNLVDKICQEISPSNSFSKEECKLISIHELLEQEDNKRVGEKVGGKREQPRNFKVCAFFPHIRRT